MRFRDSLLTALLLCATSVATAQGRLPIFEDDDPVWADEEIHSRLRAPRPIFADEPFFEDDVTVSETSEPIITVECTTDFPAVAGETAALSPEGRGSHTGQIENLSHSQTPQPAQRCVNTALRLARNAAMPSF